jgi:hypothetical protein
MKLTDILNEIKVVPGGKQILWGYNSSGKFTELAKLRGFKTPQEALDKINQALPNEEPYELSSGENDPSYAYLSDDGQVTFVKDLSEFSEGYDTEDSWGVDEWSKEPPF